MCLHIYKTCVVYRIFLQHEAGGIHCFTADNRLLANSDLTDLRRQTGFTMKTLVMTLFLQEPNHIHYRTLQFLLHWKQVQFIWIRVMLLDESSSQGPKPINSSDNHNFFLFNSWFGTRIIFNARSHWNLAQAKDVPGHEHRGYHSLGRHDNWQNLNILMVN